VAERLDPKRANLLYHDAAARTYDDKWAISFDDRCIRYVGDRAARMLPERRYERVLEIGCGTGFFILNLWQAGYVGRPFACDLSPGMLEVCAENARRIGCDIDLRTGDAERLPYAEGSFDLVVGHAFLHHLPDPELALAEACRVVEPGGAIFFAGEPTRRGDRLAKAVGRATHGALGLVRKAVPALRPPTTWRRRPDEGDALADLEWDVDLHTFVPDHVVAMAERQGFEQVRVETEELVSSVFGWAVRTFEAEAPPGLLGAGWAGFAYGAWRSLYALDAAILYRLVPKSLFYNLLVYGERCG